MAKRRHEHTHARWCAVQALYSAEIRGVAPHAAIEDGSCLCTGDVLDELVERTRRAEAAWEPRYCAWLAEVERAQAEAEAEAGEGEGAAGFPQAPQVPDADVSGLAAVLPLPDYAVQLVQGVEDHKADIDERLARVSSNWSVGRMPVADRCILRLAAFEMLYVDATPVSVAINEAVDLAKYFGGQDESSQFVNGVLGRIAREAAEAGASGAVDADATCVADEAAAGTAAAEAGATGEGAEAGTTGEGAEAPDGENAA